MHTKVFAWFMYFAALVKIALFFVLVGLSLAIIGGAGSTGSVNNGSTWRDLDPFKNGFSVSQALTRKENIGASANPASLTQGFAYATLCAVWASGDQIFMGIMGGEATSPRLSMAHATKLVPWRIITVFMNMVIFAGLLIRSDDERLLLGSTVTASPFVIAAIDAGIPGMAHLLNACIMIAVLSMSVESVYISSRVLRTMAHQKLVPEFLARIDRRGQPYLSLLVTAAVSLLCTYINLACK